MTWARACFASDLEENKPFSAEVGDELVAIIRRIGVDDVEAGLIAEVERELAATVGAAPASVER